MKFNLDMTLMAKQRERTESLKHFRMRRKGRLDRLKKWHLLGGVWPP